MIIREHQTALVRIFRFYLVLLVFQWGYLELSELVITRPSSEYSQPDPLLSVGHFLELSLVSLAMLFKTHLRQVDFGMMY